jgi:hypothetical protein
MSDTPVVDDELMQLVLTDFPEMFVASTEIDGIMVENHQTFVRFRGCAQYWVTEHTMDEILNMIRADEERISAFEHNLRIQALSKM